MSATPNGNASLSLRLTQESVSGHMDKILGCFKPGAKITVLVRRPEHPGGSQDFMMTNDDPAAAIIALQIRKAQGEDCPSAKG